MLGDKEMGRLRVLIADDNDSMRAAVGRLLGTASSSSAPCLTAANWWMLLWRTGRM